MTAYYDAFSALLAMFLLTLLLLAFVPSRRGPLTLASAALALATLAVPVYESTLHIAVRSIMTPVSAAFLVFGLSSVVSFIRGRGLCAARDEAAFVAAVTALGAVLYLSALGAVRADVYRFGYDARVGAALGLALLLYGVAARSWMTIGWVAAAAVLKLFGAIDSANAFDHFIDPMAWIAGVSLALTHTVAKLTPWTIPFLGYRMSARPGRPMGPAARRQAAETA